MGFSLHVQRAGGQQGDLLVARESDVLAMFRELPWAEELREWEGLPLDLREERRPVMEVFDDAGRRLSLVALDGEVAEVSYVFPGLASGFGVAFEDENGCVGTDRFPQAEVPALIRCFYQGVHRAMVALIEKHLPQENHEE